MTRAARLADELRTGEHPTVAQLSRTQAQRLNAPYRAKLRAMTRARRDRDTAHTMTEESTTPDVEEIRRWVEADSYDEFAAFIQRYYAADAVWDGFGGLGPFEGLPAILAFLKEYGSMWEEHHHYLEDAVYLDRGVGYVVVREYSRMKGSEGQLEARGAWVTTWDDGKVVRSTAYTDIDAGRVAAERLAQERG